MKKNFKLIFIEFYLKTPIDFNVEEKLMNNIWAFYIESSFSKFIYKYY